MSEPGGEETNERGGRQSKLYVNYDLIDPWAMESLAAILHRGKKYGIDNWRKIDVESHLNHAMNHITVAMKRYTTARILRGRPLQGDEDDLAHALCRVMFALAKEIEIDGPHPEHSDPKYHEPKAPSTEPGTIRGDGSGVRSILSAVGLVEGTRRTATFNYPRRRNNPKRPSKTQSRSRTRIRTSAVRGKGRRRR